MASSAECGMGDTGANRERKLKRNGDPYGERFQGEEERMGKNARTTGVYWRADTEDMNILDGRDDRQRAELIAERLRHWKSITNA